MKAGIELSLDLDRHGPLRRLGALLMYRTWTVVLAPVSRMESRGLTEAMLASGKPVTLEGYPRRDGTPEMRIERVTAQGKTVELR